MKRWLVAATVLVSSAGLVAQAAPAKSSSTKSAIAVSLAQLNCTTAAGPGAFDVTAWSWGASNPVDLSSGGGGGTGKVNIADLNLMKSFDACSPALFGAVATGKAFPTLTLTATNKDGNTTTVTLSEVFVTSWQASGSLANEVAAESVSFTFGRVCLADGSSNTRFCWDVKANKQF